MEKILLIAEALEFIEANLTYDMKTDDMAKSLFCSKSYLEKAFQICDGYEYQGLFFA